MYCFVFMKCFFLSFFFHFDTKPGKVSRIRTLTFGKCNAVMNLAGVRCSREQNVSARTDSIQDKLTYRVGAHSGRSSINSFFPRVGLVYSINHTYPHLQCVSSHSKKRSHYRRHAHPTPTLSFSLIVGSLAAELEAPICMWPFKGNALTNNNMWNSTLQRESYLQDL